MFFNRRRTENTMAKRKRTKGQTSISTTLQHIRIIVICRYMYM